MMKRPQPTLNFAATLVTLLGLSLTLTASALATPSAADSSPAVASPLISQSAPPDPAPAPPPNGNRSPGGSLSGDDEVTSCPTPSTPLTALTPASVLGQTLSEKPTLWFYIPYSPQDVQKGEFSILTQDETQRVYETTFTLPATPGLVSIQVPPAAAAKLSDGQYYHWYLSLYCTSSTRPDLNIDGWIQPLASTPEREQQVSNLSLEVWYDTVSVVAEQLQAMPSPTAGGLALPESAVPAGFAASPETSLTGQTPSASVRTDWREEWTALLNAVDLAHLVDEPVVGPVLLSP